MAFGFLLLYLIAVYLRPTEWVPGFMGWPLLSIALLVTAFLFCLRIALTKGSNLVRIPHNRMMVGFFLAMILSHVAHGYMGGVTHVISIFLVNLIMYFLVVNVLNTPAKVKIAVWVIVALTAILAVQGIAQAARGYGWAGQGLTDGRITWIGIFDDPNDLAMAFVTMVPILLAYILGPSFIGLKWLPLGLIGLLVYGTYLTNSRGGMLALVAAIGFFFIRRSKHRVLGGVLGGAAALLLFLFGPSRMASISAAEESAAGRLDAWHYGFQLLKQNPVFGAGQDMFTNDYPLTAHNSFVLAFAELGLVGFFFWVALLYLAFKGLAVAQRNDGPLRPYTLGLQSALVGFCAAAFFLSRTYIMLPYLLVALSAAMANVVRKRTPELAVAFTGRDARNVAGICVGILVLLQVAMRTCL